MKNVTRGWPNHNAAIAIVLSNLPVPNVRLRAGQHANVQEIPWNALGHVSVVSFPESRRVSATEVSIQNVQIRRSLTGVWIRSVKRE